MKTEKRAQSTLNREYGFLRNHPECRIYKSKNEETYIWQYNEHCPTSIITLYFRKQGNIIGVADHDENGNLRRNLELR